MIIASRGAQPSIHDDAYVAPSAVVSGDVTIGAGSRILHGAVVTAEGGPVTIGERSIVMESAVVKGRDRNPVVIGDHVLVGPHCHVNGATIEDRCHLATGAVVYPGALVREGSELRVRSIVQVNTALAPRAVVPIGWVAVGDPAQLASSHDYEEMWRAQQGLDIAGADDGAQRTEAMVELMTDLSELYGQHRDDAEVDGISS